MLDFVPEIKRAVLPDHLLVTLQVHLRQLPPLHQPPEVLLELLLQSLFLLPRVQLFIQFRPQVLLHQVNVLQTVDDFLERFHRVELCLQRVLTLALNISKT